MSPQSAPGGRDHLDGTDQAANSGEPGSTPPRPFFAEPPEGPRDSESGGSASEPSDQAQPYGEPRVGGPRYGQSPAQLPPGGQPGGQAPGEPRGPAPGRWPPAGPAPGGWPADQRQPPMRQRPGRELRQRAMASLLFGIFGLIALFSLGTDLRKGIYLLGFGALVGLAGTVIGITALVKARRTGSYRPRGAIAGIVIGAFTVLVSVPIIVTYLIFPTQVTSYFNCLSQAQNQTAQRACTTKFYKSVHLGTAAPAAPSRSYPR